MIPQKPKDWPEYLPLRRVDLGVPVTMKRAVGEVMRDMLKGFPKCDCAEPYFKTASYNAAYHSWICMRCEKWLTCARVAEEDLVGDGT